MSMKTNRNHTSRMTWKNRTQRQSADNAWSLCNSCPNDSNLKWMRWLTIKSRNLWRLINKIGNKIGYKKQPCWICSSQLALELIPTIMVLLIFWSIIISCCSIWVNWSSQSWTKRMNQLIRCQCWSLHAWSSVTFSGTRFQMKMFLHSSTWWQITSNPRILSINHMRPPASRNF